MVDNIKKSEIVDSIYEKLNSDNTSVEKNKIQKIVDAFLDEIKESLIDGKTIELRGFGTFETRLRKGKEKAHNPKTGAELKVEPHYVAAFRAGKELKKNLWNIEKADEK